jgi:hypothetical protein
MQGISDREYKSKEVQLQGIFIEWQVSIDGKFREAMIVYELKTKSLANLTLERHNATSQEENSRRLCPYDPQQTQCKRKHKGQSFCQAHFVTYCQDCTTSNQVRARLKPVSN